MAQKQRKIADPQHNRFVEEHKTHQRTRVAPASLINRAGSHPPSFFEHADEVARELAAVLGPPFYSRAGYILYNADCLEVLRKLARSDTKVALTVTSPPYNLGKEYEEKWPVERYTSWCSDWMTLIHSVTTPEGAFWLNLGYLEVPGRGLCVPISYLLWDKSPFYLLQEVVWHYGAGVSTKKRLSPRNEKWMFFVKDPSSYSFNLDDIRDPNVKYPNQKKNGKFRCNPLGKNPSDVWSFPKVTTGRKRSSRERTRHPAQFPLPVVERVVLASSDPNQLVLDPFAGSGSTGLAASALGRVFVGIERDKNYCEMAAERHKMFLQAVAEERAQQRLLTSSTRPRAFRTPPQGSAAIADQ